MTRVRWRALLGVSLGAAVWLLSGTPVLAGATERVSVSSSGEQGNAHVGGDGIDRGVSISADGRYVAFESHASNLVPGDTNGVKDVFVHDRVTRTTERVSVSSTGEQGDRKSRFPSISADGRYVAFESWASNLVPGDTNGSGDILVRDRLADTTERASVSSAGEEGNESCQHPAISADGRYVAFNSYASNLVPGDTNGTDDVFVRDRLAGVTERVSVSSTGEQANAQCWESPSISADGRYVAFDSWASNLVPGDTNVTRDVFVRDRVAGTTERVSVSSTGEQGADQSWAASISADGRYVAFHSTGFPLTPGGTGVYVVFVRDRMAGTTERMSVSTIGGRGSGDSLYPSISADGRHVAFHSYAFSLVPEDSNGRGDVFVRDRVAETTERVSVSSTGEEGDSGSEWASISADGRWVAFRSWSRNLVPDDTNGKEDAFVRERWEVPFEDVPVDHWAFAETGACLAAGVVQGYWDGTYRPSEQVDRASMAVYISRGLVIPSGDVAIPDPEPPPSFSDVPADHWAYKWIEYAVSRNVVQGYPGGSYHPDEAVNRGQMAVYVARATVSPSGDAALPDPPAEPTFPDVTADSDWSWCYKHVEYIAGLGIVQGYWDGTYRPEAAVTRDQMAVYVARAFELPM